MTLTEQQMHEIGNLRRQLAEAHDLRLITIRDDTGYRGSMYGFGAAGRASADAYNFLASLQARHLANAEA
jgi:hypothetical protein